MLKKYPGIKLTNLKPLEKKDSENQIFLARNQDEVQQFLNDLFQQPAVLNSMEVSKCFGLASALSEILNITDKSVTQKKKLQRYRTSPGRINLQEAEQKYKKRSGLTNNLFNHFEFMSPRGSAPNKPQDQQNVQSHVGGGSGIPFTSNNNSKFDYNQSDISMAKKLKNYNNNSNSNNSNDLSQSGNNSQFNSNNVNNQRDNSTDPPRYRTHNNFNRPLPQYPLPKTPNIPSNNDNNNNNLNNNNTTTSDNSNNNINNIEEGMLNLDIQSINNNHNNSEINNNNNNNNGRGEKKAMGGVNKARTMIRRRSGYLIKIGKKRRTKYWFELVDSFLYSYHKPKVRFFIF